MAAGACGERAAGHRCEERAARAPTAGWSGRGEGLVAEFAQDVEAEVRRHFGPLVFKTSVPRSVRLAEAPSHGLPAIAYDRNSAGADAYWKVAMELVERR